jgi:hypothetical protein
MPGLPVCLVTDKPTESPAFDTVIVAEENTLHPYQFKLNMWMAPYEKVVFLDSDTQLVGDIGELFKLLDNFDIACHKDWFAYAVAQYAPDVPFDVFPEYNAGVLAFRNTPRMREFFTAAAAEYQAMFLESGFFRMQRSFLKTLLLSDLRVADLPVDYNFMPYNSQFLGGHIRVIHGRFPESQRRLMTPAGMSSRESRIFIPQMGVVWNLEGKTRGWPRLWFLLRLGFRAFGACLYWFFREDLPGFPHYVISIIRVRGGAIKARLRERRRVQAAGQTSSQVEEEAHETKNLP